MTGEGSFRTFASYYDLIYADKDYAREVAFLEGLLRDVAGHRPSKVLELGCGTGNYTQVLLDHGYQVTGVDLSHEMLKAAGKKCNCTLIQGDLKDVRLGKKFDTCLSMFAVMGYVTGNDDFEKALRNVKSHLARGGIFIFDVWNGLAVMKDRPETRVKEAEDAKLKIARIAVPRLRAAEHICEVNYKLFVEHKAIDRFYEFEETHVMRFFFPQEISYYLDKAGFDVLKICPFMEPGREIDENAWSMTIVARSR